MQTCIATEQVATYFLKKEQSIIEKVRSLLSVRNFQRVVFGEGAKTSATNNRSSSMAISRSELENFWFCLTNDSKLCAEGACANLLFFMGLKDDAIEFRLLASISNAQELAMATSVDNIPKKLLISVMVLIQLKNACGFCRRNSHAVGLVID